ncbi:MAG TPA: hypothetical protein VFE30_02905 [Anaeromyxobacteraceae bacterium]|nr:hypothetical protein [Anaeromyxobacteraceae bacterium]
MSAVELASLPPLRAYGLALVAALAIAMVRGAAERRVGVCALALGGLAVLGHAVTHLTLGFSGVVDLGEGEPAGAWTRVIAGPRAAEPPALELRSVPVSASAPVRVALEGREMDLARDWSHHASGARLRVVETGIAPRLVFESVSGATLDEGLLKLPMEHAASDYLEIPILPHRFYLSRTSAAVAGSELKVPDVLHLKVTRGKLTLVDRDLPKGEATKMDGFTVRYLDGLPWARIELERDPGAFLLYVGVALLLAGAAIELRARRSTSRASPEPRS